MMISVDKILEILAKCDLRQLREIESALEKLIRKAESAAILMGDDEARQLRKEHRFDTDIVGSLLRLSDVKPNERTEYTVHVTDVSRSGIRIRVQSSFIPSRLVKVSFPSPSGQMKTCVVEVVRMKKIVVEGKNWLEVGCRSTTEEAVQQILDQEKATKNVMRKLSHKSEIRVMVVSPVLTKAVQIVNRIKKEGYQVLKETTIMSALQTASNVGVELLVLLDAQPLLQAKDQMQALQGRPGEIATLAIISNIGESKLLLQSNIDEFLPADQVEDFIPSAIERALVGHAARMKDEANSMSPAALIASRDRTKINLLGYYLTEFGMKWHGELEYVGLTQGDPYQVQIVFADFDPTNTDLFLRVRQNFPDVPLIALCETIKDGSMAIAMQANNYLGMPFRAKETNMLLENMLGTAKTV